MTSNKEWEDEVMTIEDKAKAYDEALKRAKKWLNAPNVDKIPTYGNRVIEEIFPELKESEDEKIRKELIAHCRNTRCVTEEGAEQVKNWIVWLEKQGEQKPIIDGILTATNYDKMFQNCNVHKFNVGDWVISTLPGIKYPHLITDIRDGYYIFGEDDDHAHIASNDDVLKLWTIQDAKDGDVLVYRNSVTEIIMLFKSWVVDRTAAYTHFHIFDNDFRVNNSCDCGNGAQPATKQQRDLLFQKMHEAGWEFDFDKKELKKISQRMISAEAKEAMYDKPTDLEVFINELSKQFPDVSFAKLSRIAVRVAKWAKPADEEMKELLRTEYEKGRADAIAEMHKPVWSEEDKIWIESLIQTFEDGYLEGFNQLKSYGVISWLKSLKERL